MTVRFPGMDPYLEGYLWPDVHSALANKIRQLLGPRIQPRYVARLEVTFLEDETPELEVGVMYPDVEVVEANRPLPVPYEGIVVAEAATMTAAPVMLALPKLRLTSVEIRDAAHNSLVTAIEILSPVNKREPGATYYQQKCTRLRLAGVHILEIDLLRRGKRRWHSARLPSSAYLVTLARGYAHSVAAWPVQLPDPLPTVPVPLRAPDDDVPLDLNAALHAIYEEAYYQLSIDYTQLPPPPPLTEEETAWMRSIVGKSPS